MSAEAETELEDLLKDVEYKLTDNQREFAIAALDAGLEINFDYSGRNMYGRECPSVVVPNLKAFHPSAEHKTDNMGYDYVIYAPN